MLRGLFRFLLAILAVAVVRYLIGVITSAFSPKRTAEPAPRASSSTPAPAAGVLKRDPVCGVYVAAASSVTATVRGQTLHFCSTACRDRHLEQQETP